jgi:L-asparagine oxygenase
MNVGEEVIGPSDRHFLIEAANEMRMLDHLAYSEEFVLNAQLLCAGLSENLRRRLIAFRRFGHPSGGLLIRGVPVGDIPDTPESLGPHRGTRQAIAAMSVLLANLGEQFGFRPELGGAIVQDVIPIADFEADQISLGSTVDLETHTEMAFSPFRSDYVALLCIRQDHACTAGTTLSSIDAMLPLLDPEAVVLLREPRFRTKVDKSFLLGTPTRGDVWIDSISPLDGPAERPWLRVDFAETDGKDVAAKGALDALRKAAAQIRLVLRLEVGDMLLIDNHRALHGRTPFVPRYDGRDRWLLRSFLTKDLRRSEIARPRDGRIVEPDYSAIDRD